MALLTQKRIPEDVYACVHRMRARFYDQAYKGRHQETISRAVEVSNEILSTYQASEGKSLGEQHWFLYEYVQWILGKIEGDEKYNLPGILLQLRFLVKIFSPEKKESPQGKKDELQKLQNEIDKLRKSLDEERVAKDELLQRLSIVAADRMKTGNPEIADLSDANRPMKLAEKFNELYSNAWADAYERLQKSENICSNSSSENSIQKPYRKPESNNDDEDTTRILFQALKSCYEWSQKAADCQRRAIIKAGMGNIDFLTNLKSLRKVKQDEGPLIVKTGQAMSKSLWGGNQVPGYFEKTPAQVSPQSLWRGNQDPGFFEKMRAQVRPQAEDNAGVINADKTRVKDEEMESSTLDNPAKEFMRCAALESSKRLPEKICLKVMEDKTYKDIEVYIQKCAELCWLMNIQFPPIELLFDIKPNDKFDHTYHRSYTTSGDKIAFPVWPTMLLHKEGPVLALGVVQCVKK